MYAKFTLNESIMKSRIQSYIYIISVLVLLGSLFLLRGNISRFLSGIQTKNSTDIKHEAIADTIIKRYNYNRNDSDYQVTFLEFGATTCHSCQLIEKVMEEVRERYSSKVNTVFINVTLPANKDIVKYFGIVTIPAQILLDKNGKEYYRHEGYISADDLSKQFFIRE